MNSYGAVPDGAVGLVYPEPFSDEVIEGLHGQVYRELGYTDGAPESVREQVQDALSRESLALQLPYLRSNGGYRVTVRVDGNDHTVDVQLTLSDARESLRQGRFDTWDPDKHVERRGFGTRENFSSQPSGTYRDGAGAVDRFVAARGADRRAGGGRVGDALPHAQPGERRDDGHAGRADDVGPAVQRAFRSSGVHHPLAGAQRCPRGHRGGPRCRRLERAGDRTVRPRSGSPAPHDGRPGGGFRCPRRPIRPISRCTASTR
ncbi:hypothetical protein ACRAWF_43505 [Streptomyces sp. L7]